jgi:ABC-type uncharacterized transport system permease subunit
MVMRLLRPSHPFFAYAASHVAAIPFRSFIALPVAFVLLASSGASALSTDPAQLVLLVPSLVLECDGASDSGLRHVGVRGRLSAEGVRP